MRSVGCRSLSVSVLCILWSFLWLWALRNPCSAGSPVLSRFFTARSGAGLLASMQHWEPRASWVGQQATGWLCWPSRPASPAWPPLLRVQVASCGLRVQLLGNVKALQLPQPSSPPPGQPSCVTQACFQMSGSLSLSTTNLLPFLWCPVRLLSLQAPLCRFGP